MNYILVGIIIIAVLGALLWMLIVSVSKMEKTYGLKDIEDEEHMAFLKEWRKNHE